MTAVARAGVRAYVEWGETATGILSIAEDDADTAAGTIAVNDADVAAGVISAGDWPATFGGPYDDVSSRLRRVTVTRGRNDRLDEILGGSGTIDLRDPTGIFNPSNPSSPLAGEIEERLHPAIVTWVYLGVELPWFAGWVRHVGWEPQGRKGIAQLELVDLFYWLERAWPTIAATGPTTTGAAIGLILDAIVWTEPGRRSLDEGDAIPDFSADGSKTALTLIGELLEAELGVFYISAAGVATYESRHARATRPTSATISDRMTRLVGAVDFDAVRNRVTVERSQNGYVAEALDAGSRAPGQIGPADLPPLVTPYLETDSQADGLAEYLLSLVLDPKPPLRELALDNRDADLLEQIVTRELIDRVAIQEGAGGTDGDFHIDRMTVSVVADTRRRISASWLLSRSSASSPLLIAVDDADVVGGTIAVDDDDVAAGVIAY